MKIYLFILSFSCGIANAVEIKPVEDQERAWLLYGINVLLDKNNPHEFPAVVRVVSVPTPLSECESNAAMEEICPQEDLYIAFSNWDIAPDIHAFKIGRADEWRVGDLALDNKKNQSFWTGSLTIELDRYTGKRKVTESIKIEITNEADQYTLNLEN